MTETADTITIIFAESLLATIRVNCLDKDFRQKDSLGWVIIILSPFENAFSFLFVAQRGLDNQLDLGWSLSRVKSDYFEAE